MRSFSFYSLMGMEEVVPGPDGKPIQLTGSRIDLGNMARVAALTGVSAALLAPGTAVNSNCIYARPRVLSSEVRGEKSLSNLIAYCRFHLSLNMTELASALGVERQTLYGWLTEAYSPNHQNEKRLDLLVSIARDWEKTLNGPIGKARTCPLSSGKSFSEMLAAAEIDRFQIRNCFVEIKQLSSQKSRGQERHTRLQSLGYDQLSVEESSERLGLNIPG